MHCDYLLTLLARPDFDRTKLPSRSPQSYPAPFTPPRLCLLPISSKCTCKFPCGDQASVMHSSMRVL